MTDLSARLTQLDQQLTETEPHSPECCHGKTVTYGGGGEGFDYETPWTMTTIGCDCDRETRIQARRVRVQVAMIEAASRIWHDELGEPERVAEIMAAAEREART